MKCTHLPRRALAALTAVCIASAALPAGISTALAAGVEDKLAASYLFDGSFADSIHPSVAGTAQGASAPTLATDETRGQVLSATESNGYIQTANPLYQDADLAQTGLTVSAWINPATSNSWRGYWSFADGDGFFGMAGNGRIYYNDYAQGSGGTTSFQDMTAFDNVVAANGGWQLITTTLTGSNVSVYKNGVLQQSIAPGTNTGETGADMLDYIATVQHMNFGTASIRYNWGSTQFKMDDFKVYAQAMTAEQVLETYLSDPLTASSLIAADKAALSLPELVRGDLALPEKGASGHTSISWKSGDSSIISDAGKVTRPSDADREVTLTATISLGGQSDTVDIPVTVAKLNPDADLAEAADALSLNAGFVSSDLALPSASGEAAVQWSSSDQALISSAGKVTRPDGENKAVTLTATLSISGTDKKETRDFPLTVLAKGGQLLSYTSSKPATGQNGGMKLAIQQGDGYAALHSGQPILYSGQGTRNLADPQIFRKADGSFGVLALDGGKNNNVVLYDSADLLTYSGERLVTLPGLSSLQKVFCVYDSQAGLYKLFCQDGGSVLLLTTTDFTRFSEPVAAAYVFPADAANPPSDAAQSAVADLTQAELDVVRNKFAAVENTGMAQLPNLRINQNGTYTLPATATALYSDGSAKDFGVSWSEQDVAKIDVSKPGTYTVNGTLRSFTAHTDVDAPLIRERADPFITYNQDDGYYYFTASYPMHGGGDADGYDRLILRRAKTIEGLASADEVTVWDENMDDGSGASGFDSFGRFIWAPELHKIGGAWYFISTAGDDPEGNRFSIRPFMLKCENPADMMNPASWGKPQRVKTLGGDTSCMNAMSLDMSHFAAGGKDYLVWADVTQGDSSLYIATIDPANPTQLTSKPTIITVPEFNWERVNNRVNEGPAILQHNGKVYMAFSASGTGMEYCVGLLSANAGDDLLNVASWDKTCYPILTSGDFQDTVSGPGHNSFTVDQDGNPVLVYHARPTEEHKENADGTHGGDPLYDPCRHCYVKAVNFAADGTPILNMTEEQELKSANKSVQIQVVVSDTEQPNALTSLFIKTLPGKQAYQVGESFDPAGMQVVARYEDGSTKTLDNSDLTVSPETFTQAGRQTVTVSYQGKQATLHVSVTQTAAVSAPVLEYTFDEAFSGTTVKDSAGGNDAAVYGSAVYAQDPDYGQVLYLDGSTNAYGNDSYLAFPQGFFDNRNQMTISMDINEVTRSGNYFTFGLGQDDNKYLFLKTEPEYMKLAITTGSYGAEKTAAKSFVYPNNSRTWINVKMVVTPTSISLYQDGRLLAQNTRTSLSISDLGSNLQAYLGKSFYSGDKYFRGYFDNVRVYDQAMTADQVQMVTAQEAAKRAEWQSDLARVADSFSIPNAGNIRGNITLPEQQDGVSISWTSSDEQVISTQKTENDNYDATPAGVVTRQAADTPVALTAVFSRTGAASITKTYDVTVKAKPAALKPDDYAGYLFAHFTGSEGRRTDEQTYFSLSADGLHWEDLNGNQPVLQSSIGESGLRDHFITRSPEGDKFYMIATDLSIYENKAWAQAGASGSHSIVVWESEDLVNWSEPWLAEIAPENAGCTWAPEFIYDEKTGEYVVYWAATTLELNDSGEIAQQYENHTIYYAKTRDFRRFTDPQVYHSGGRNDSGSPIKVIDSTMIEENGTYYRYTKNESKGIIVVDQSHSVLGDFTEVPSDTLTTDLMQAQGAVEGPIIFKLNQKSADGKDQWCLMVDRFARGQGYYPLVTTDLSSGEFTMLSSDQFSMPSKYRHGYVMPITKAEYSALQRKWGSADYVDTYKLESAIQAAQGIQPDGYTHDSYSALQTALAAAEKALDTVASTAEADAAAAELQKAIDALEVLTLTSIRVTPPTKTEYTVGEQLDTAGMTVEAVYQDGTVAEVTEKAVLSGYDKTKAGKQTVTVTYEQNGASQTASFTVTVKEASSEPSEPDEPSEPSGPSEPDEPSEPSGPSEPDEPSQPGESNKPGEPSGPSKPGQPSKAEKPSAQTSDATPIAGAAAVLLAAGTAAVLLRRRRK